MKHTLTLNICSVPYFEYKVRMPSDEESLIAFGNTQEEAPMLETSTKAGKQAEGNGQAAAAKTEERARGGNKRYPPGKRRSATEEDVTVAKGKLFLSNENHRRMRHQFSEICAKLNVSLKTRNLEIWQQAINTLINDNADINHAINKVAGSEEELLHRRKLLDRMCQFVAKNRHQKLLRQNGEQNGNGRQQPTMDQIAGPSNRPLASNGQGGAYPAPNANENWAARGPEVQAPQPTQLPFRNPHAFFRNNFPNIDPALFQEETGTAAQNQEDEERMAAENEEEMAEEDDEKIAHGDEGKKYDDEDEDMADE